jgi:hypothetical protein
MLQNGPQRLLLFHFDEDPDPTFHLDADLDPDPAFHFDVDPDPASQNDADSCGSGYGFRSGAADFNEA